jgi:hypothetical protein
MGVEAGTETDEGSLAEASEQAKNALEVFDDATGEEHDGAGLALEAVHDLAEGKDLGQTAARTAGREAADEAAKSLYGGEVDPIDAGINAVNSLIQSSDLPPEVKETSQVVADVTPTSFISSTFSEGAEAVENLLNGDWDALKKQGEDMENGKAGAPLQGYAMVGDLVGEIADGKDLDEAILSVGSHGHGVLKDVGDAIGGGVYDLFHGGEDEAAANYRTMHNQYSSLLGEIQTVLDSFPAGQAPQITTPGFPDIDFSNPKDWNIAGATASITWAASTVATLRQQLASATTAPADAPAAPDESQPAATPETTEPAAADVADVSVISPF